MMRVGAARSLLGAGFLVGLGFVLAGCNEGGDAHRNAAVPLAVATAPMPTRDPERPNFVFVLIDTLRADHVGAYGYERDTTPFIDSLADQGLVFEHAVAQAPWTGSSMASIWTSRFPSEVGAGVLPDPSGQRFLGKTGSTKLRRDVPTVAEALARDGYRTFALVPNAYAAGFFGLLRGFTVKRQRAMPAQRLTDTALRLLRADLEAGKAEPFFLYVHYLDVHEPTFPPPPYRAMFPAADGSPHLREHSRWNFGNGYDATDPDYLSFRDHKIGLYDGALRYVDDQISRIAEFLRTKGILDRTVFIIASDHGEEFWDHGDFEKKQHVDVRGISGIGHGQSLFGELTDVPLILSGPGVPTGRIDGVVRNLDLAPTIYALAGIESENLDLRGVDLRTMARSVRPLDAFSESISYGVEAKSLQSEGWKLIRYSSTKSGRTEFLFDRDSDSAEQRDRLEEEPEIAAQLGAKLDATLAGMQKGPRGSKTELDAKTRAQLEAIGYLD